MQIDLATYEELLAFVQNNKIAVLYFSTPSCNVCKVLKPKILDLLTEEFPKIAFGYVNCDENKIAAAQNSVFTVPTLVVFAEGKEVIRKSRNIGLAELSDDISRIRSFLN